MINKLKKLKCGYSCINCIFLTKEMRNLNTKAVFSLSDDERLEIKNMTFKRRDTYGYCCYHGIWDTGIKHLNDEKFLLNANKKRKMWECMYYKYDEDMLFPAAINLLKLKTNRHAIIISYISLLVTFVTVIVTIIKE